MTRWGRAWRVGLGAILALWGFAAILPRPHPAPVVSGDVAGAIGTTLGICIDVVLMIVGVKLILAGKKSRLKADIDAALNKKPAPPSTPEP